MWEYLTVALSGIGFVLAVAVLLVELPRVLGPAVRAHRERFVHLARTVRTRATGPEHRG